MDTQPQTEPQEPQAPTPNAEPNVQPEPQEEPQTVEAPTEPTSAEPEAPSEPQAPTEDSDEVDIPTFRLTPPYQQPPQPQAQPQAIPNLDPKDFTDPYTGTVDMAKFGQSMQLRDQRMAQILAEQVTQRVMEQATQMTTQQVMAAKAEERQWETAFKKYPDLRENNELRDLVHNTRMNYLQRGTTYTPRQAADRLFKYIGQAKQEGTRAATQSIRTQASAHLETADNTASDSQVRNREMYSKIDSRDRTEATVARQALLKNMLADGKL